MTSNFRSLISQWFPGKPTFTDANVPPQDGKVFIVTGGNIGCGYELVKILYAKGAKVYILCRSQEKAKAAMEAIKQSAHSTSGDVKFIPLDLADLTTVKPAVEAFAAQEKKLDVLWNNAGIGGAPVGAKTKQEIELILGVDTVGHFLLTKLLLPYLQVAASSAPKDSVRVIFYGSPIIEGNAPLGGIPASDLANPGRDPIRNYGIAKAGSMFLASEYSKRVKGDGIVSVAMNPGNLLTKIWDQGPLWGKILLRPTMHPVVYGAYTSLWTGLSGDVKFQDGGRYAVPWGKWAASVRKDLVDAMLGEEEGGTGEAGRFWCWCEEMTEAYS
jgi:NAD(P)-dependent dehydrogenase (short-subunit alcohol dehydrogenase family)